jgi:hypothetical protein
MAEQTKQENPRLLIIHDPEKGWSCQMSQGFPLDGLCNQLELLILQIRMSQLQAIQQQMMQEQANKIVAAPAGASMPKTPWG